MMRALLSLPYLVGGGRGKHCMMEEWEHFTRLQDDGYIGKTNFFYAICRHCQRAFDEAPAEKKSVLVPERMVGRREKMRKHLSLCPHFQGELPPVERRIVVKPSSLSLAASSSQNEATGDGGEKPEAQPSSAAAAAIALAATVAAGGKPASASTTAVTTTSTTSSRLALDEWQYFTRLERKKDSAYYFARCNFCQHALENAPEALKGSMEAVIVVGRKANMQTHLSKCAHVPQDMLTVSLKASPLSVDSISAASATAAVSTANAGGGVPGFEREEHGYPAAKRMRVGVRGDSAPVLDTMALYSSLLEFTIQHRLPFEWTESESTKKLFRVLPTTHEMETLLPTAQELRTQVLNEMYDRAVSSELLELKEPLPSTIGTAATAGADAPQQSIWPLTVHCTATLSTTTGSGTPVLQCVLTNGKAQAPVPQYLKRRSEDAAAVAGVIYEEIPAVAYQHGLEVARWLDVQIHQCKELQQVVPAVVVVPYSSAFDRAVKILRACWPRVVFVYDFQGLLQFCLQKVFASEEVQSLVAALAELWTSEGIVRIASHITNPFKDWQECSLFMQSLVDESALYTTNGELKAKVDEKVSRSLLERVSLLLRAFSLAYESASEKQLSFAETVRHIGLLFHASEGFTSIQRALEVIWFEMEQPLFILAHALHPHLRLGDMASSELTKLSKLSDLGVTYFADLFGRKPTSLRGEMTAYLHTSQTVFSQEFVSEFPVLDDYFRYLSDDYASLSMLMRLLLSFSSVCADKQSPESVKASPSAADRMYTAKERTRITYLIQRCNITQIKSYGAEGEDQQHTDEEAAEAMVVEGAASTEAPEGLTGDSILLAWNRALVAMSTAQGVEFALLEVKHAARIADAVENSISAASTTDTVAEVAAAVAKDLLALPSQAADDEVAFPSTFLSGGRAKKITLKELFKPVEATI